MRVTVFPPNSQNDKGDRQGPASRAVAVGFWQKALEYDKFIVVQPGPVCALSTLFTQAHPTTHPWEAGSLTSFYS